MVTKQLIILLSKSVRRWVIIGVVIPSAKQPEHCQKYVALLNEEFNIHVNNKSSPTV